jgi:perosamine synthetase
MEVRMFHPFISDQAIENAVRVLKGRWIGQGPMVDQFEEAIGEKFNFTYPVMLNSGTAGLHLALVLAGVGPGDEVVTTAQTCTASNHPILQCYARPVFADIQYNTGNIDPADVARRITHKTRAIMCVHWGGYPCDMAELKEVAGDIPIIQDGAHALGATYRNLPLSYWGDYVMISLQAIKTITTVDGGILTCPDREKYDEAIRRRWFGIDRRNRKPTVDGYWEHDVTEVGFKYQPNDVMAAIGLGNLEHYDKLYLQRKIIAQQYRNELKDVTLFEQKDDRVSGHWLFTMHVERRNDFCQAMTSRGVEVSVVHRRNDIYPVFGGRRDDLPELDRYEKTHISLPLHNQMSYDQVDWVIRAVRQGW